MNSSKQTFFLIAAALIAAFGLAFFLIFHWNFYWIWLVTLSMVTFLLYGYDKEQARRNGQRVPEIVLHVLALAGGFLGGWAGRWIFHHKTRKPVFTIVLVISTLLQLGIIYIIFLR